MTIQTANLLFNNGTLTELYKAGFLTDKVFLYREIYLWVDTQMHVRGITKNRAVLEAEAYFNRDERTIWRAVNKFSEQSQ